MPIIYFIAYIYKVLKTAYHPITLTVLRKAKNGIRNKRNIHIYSDLHLCGCPLTEHCRL